MAKGDSKKVDLTNLVLDVKKATAVRNGVNVLIDGMISAINDAALDSDVPNESVAKTLANALEASRAELVTAIAGMNTLIDGVAVEGETSKAAKKEAAKNAEK